MKELIKVSAIVELEVNDDSTVYDAIEALDKHVTNVDGNPAVKCLFVHTVDCHRSFYDSSCELYNQSPWGDKSE